MEVGWRTLFAVFLAPVMLLCGALGDQTSTCSPARSMDELGRATVAAAGVFEGRLEGPPASSSSLFVGGQLNATFTFRRWHKTGHKGKFRRVSHGAVALARRSSVVVRLGLTGDTRTTRSDSTSSCSLSDLLVPHRNYLVFVGESFQPENSDELPGVVYFQSTGFPVPSTKDAVKQIQAYGCRKCGQCFFPQCLMRSVFLRFLLSKNTQYCKRLMLYTRLASPVAVCVAI